MHLSEQERADLAATLIQSLENRYDDHATQAWDAEIQRRVAELDAGAVKPVPWMDVRRRLMRRLDDKSAA
jgi:putative addiction module component (TIGR02574 family)